MDTSQTDKLTPDERDAIDASTAHAVTWEDAVDNANELHADHGAAEAEAISQYRYLADGLPNVTHDHGRDTLMPVETVTICTGRCERPFTVRRVRADTVPTDGSATLWAETPYRHLNGNGGEHSRHEGRWVDSAERGDDGRVRFVLDGGQRTRGFLPSERVLIGS